MLCSKCKKNPASVFYKQVVNGTVREAALCSECASAMNLGINKAASAFSLPFSDGSLISGLFGDAPVRSSVQRKVCPLCGSAFSDIAHSGKVGCAKCYETFRNELMPTVTGIHGRSKHTGRCPKDHKAKAEKRNRLDELNAELNAAVQSEEYEKAAKLRDEIKRLRGENN